MSILQVPLSDEFESSLQQSAAAARVSVIDFVVAAIHEKMITVGSNPATRDLTGVVGTWEDDPELEAILQDQRQIDPELWK